MKEIALTRGKVTLVDDEDYEWLSQWKWKAMLNRTTGDYYAHRTQYLGGGRASPKY